MGAELEARGHNLIAWSDAEIVLHGYVAWGPEVLHRLNGAWAVAIWDEPRKRLFLARDRLGIRPLVYAETKDGLVFASEITALLASGLITAELDAAALPYYISSLAVPDPQTFLRGVRRLPAGHTLEVDPGATTARMYWDCAIQEEADRGARVYREEVERLVDDATRRRLGGDARPGVLLSGSVGTRVLATFAARASASVLETFCVGFGERCDRRLSAARGVADPLGTQHHELAATGDGFAPLDRASDEPSWSRQRQEVISEFARTRVSAALSGIGDELLGGGPALLWLLLGLDRLPGPVRRAIVLGAGLPPVIRGTRAASLAALEGDSRLARVVSRDGPSEFRDGLLTGEVRRAIDLHAPERVLAALFARTPAQDPLNRLAYAYTKSQLSNAVLRISDASSMIHSLDVRTPFLDHRIVELALRMPARHKCGWRSNERILRDIATRTLAVPVERRWRCTGVRVATGQGSEAAERLREALSEPVIRRRGIFDVAAVRRVREGCLAGDARMVAPAMMLYGFETWAQQCLDTGSVAAAPRSIEISVRRCTDLSVIVVNWNTREILRDCLVSLKAHLDGVDHEVIVVDNASNDGSAEMVIADFPAVMLLANSANVGFGSANNQAMRVARGDWLLLLNSDTLLTDDSVARLFDRVRGTGDIAVAQCLLRLPDGRIQHTAHRFPTLRLAVLEDLGLYKLMGRRRAGIELLGGYWDHSTERDVDWVIGAFMLLPREVFERTGGFDERLFMYGEDMEWCQRIRDSGLRIRYFPQAEIIHRDHSSAEMRYGDGRAALCLHRQHDLFRERHGAMHARAFMTVRVMGAGLRAVWYSVRARCGGRTSDGYRVMKPYVVANFRTLWSITTRHR